MRLRRKNNDETSDVELIGTPADDQPVTPTGPIDVDDLDQDAVYIDLGSLLVQPTELDLRLQVEEETGNVMAVLLVADEGILEMRAFASSRGGDLWADVRREIAADSTQRGGTATEQEGSFGTELYCEVPVTGPNGETFVQPSRVIGCAGPRWFLRATIAGRPAQDPEYAEQFEAALRSLAVRRGHEAMAPGEPLPLRLPPEARPQTAEESAADLARPEAD
jgi:hypothetical protein